MLLLFGLQTCDTSLFHKIIGVSATDTCHSNVYTINIFFFDRPRKNIAVHTHSHVMGGKVFNAPRWSSAAFNIKSKIMFLLSKTFWDTLYIVFIQYLHVLITLMSKLGAKYIKSSKACTRTNYLISSHSLCPSQANKMFSLSLQNSQFKIRPIAASVFSRL